MNEATFEDVERAVLDAIESRFEINDYLVTVNCSDEDTTLTITDTKCKKEVSRCIPIYRLLGTHFPMDIVRPTIWKMRSELMDARIRIG
jgi:hypothetical protein